MPIFTYSFKHTGGDGSGSIEAENAKDAKEKLTATLQPTDKKAEKLKNLTFEITELEQPTPEV